VKASQAADAGHRQAEGEAALPESVYQELQRRIMTAGHPQGAINLLLRLQQLRLHFLPRLKKPAAGRNPQQAVDPGQGQRGSRPPGKRQGHIAVADPADALPG
jgi:hypothetical protein